MWKESPESSSEAITADAVRADTGLDKVNRNGDREKLLGSGRSLEVLSTGCAYELDVKGAEGKK